MATKNSNIPAYTKEPRAPRLGKLPFWFIAFAITATIASWLPLVFAARARVATSTEPHIHLVQDMWIQPKHRTQESTDLFADGRIMRPKIAGTVARGKLDEDDHYFRGYVMKKNDATGKVEPSYFDEFPSNLPVTPELIKRGEGRYTIYCAPCHGLDGYGKGPVNERAVELQGLGQNVNWTQAASLHSEPARSRSAGHIYNTINVGIRNMGPYGDKVQSPADRWAIVAYVRALQLSQDPPASAIPADKVASK